MMLGCLKNQGFLTSFIIIIILFYFAHTNNYNTLHLQFITGNCYRLQKRNKKKKKDKVHKNTIVYILINILQRRAVTPTGDVLCIYGEPPYPLRPHLMGPYRDNPLTPQMRAFYNAMSEVRVSVE